MTPTLLLALALGQPSVPLPKPVQPVDITRAAATLRLLRMARSGEWDDPALESAVRDYLKANPNLSAKGLPDLLKNAPDFARDPDFLKQAQALAEKMSAESSSAPSSDRNSVPTPPNAGPDDPTPPTVPEPDSPVPDPDERLTPRFPPEPESPARPEMGSPPGSQAPDDRGGELIRKWGKYAGPLEEMPAFRGILEEFVRGVDPSSRNRGALGKLLSQTNSETMGEWASTIAKAFSGFQPSTGANATNLPDAPQFALPQTPAGVEFPSMRIMGVLIAIIIVAVIAYRRLGLPFGRSLAAASRIVAPKPGSIHDRASLVTAFDQLGPFALGPQGTHLHHRAVGQALTARGAPNQAVGALVELYEQARYTPMAEPFPVDQIATARDALRDVLASRA